MKMIKTMLATRYKISFFAIAILGFIILFYIYVLKPQTLRITELTAAKMELDKKNTVIQVFAKKHPDTNKYLTELEKEAVAADIMLPNSLDISGFLVQLERAAASSGVQLCEIKPGQTKVKAGYQEVPIEVIIKGTFVQTLAFLQNLNNTERFNSISNVSITPQQGVLASKFNIIIYSYNETNRIQDQQARSR